MSAHRMLPAPKKCSATATYDYYSSISNGTVIGNARMKGNALGTVIYNKSVEFAAGGTTGVADYRTDGYLLKDSATGKMQLILRASNKHFFIDGATDSYGNASPHFYKVVDLATFGVGVIEEVDAFALDNYYVAKIVQTDGTTKTVYIPVTPSEKTTLPVTVDGVTADYTFDSSNWCTFLTQMKDEVIGPATPASRIPVINLQQQLGWLVNMFSSRLMRTAKLSLCSAQIPLPMSAVS